MDAKTRTRTLLIIGLLVFAVGAIGMAVGTTSLPLFLLFAVLAIAGLILLLLSKKSQNKKYE